MIAKPQGISGNSTRLELIRRTVYADRSCNLGSVAWLEGFRDCAVVEPVVEECFGGDEAWGYGIVVVFVAVG